MPPFLLHIKLNFMQAKEMKGQTDDMKRNKHVILMYYIENAKFVKRN